METLTKEELTELIMENKAGMYRLAYSIVRNDADAQDAVGETILRVFENRLKLRKRDSAKAWMMQILTNTAKRIAKRKKRWKVLDDELQDEECSSFSGDQIWGVVMELPAEFRTAIVLYYYEQFTTKEIAAMLHISEGTVKSRLARARGKLARMLD